MHRLQSQSPSFRILGNELTRGLPFFSHIQIVDIIVFTTRPRTNLHFLFALVSSLLRFNMGTESSNFFFPSLKAGFTREFALFRFRRPRAW